MQILNLDIYDTRRSRRCTPLSLASISLYSFFVCYKFKNFVDFLILKYKHGCYTKHFLIVEWKMNKLRLEKSI